MCGEDLDPLCSVTNLTADLLANLPWSVYLGNVIIPAMPACHTHAVVDMCDSWNRDKSFLCREIQGCTELPRGSHITHAGDTALKCGLCVLQSK